jgi:hypothetical protein
MSVMDINGRREYYPFRLKDKLMLKLSKKKDIKLL